MDMVLNGQPAGKSHAVCALSFPLAVGQILSGALSGGGRDDDQQPNKDGDKSGFNELHQDLLIAVSKIWTKNPSVFSEMEMKMNF